MQQVELQTLLFNDCNMQNILNKISWVDIMGFYGWLYQSWGGGGGSSTGYEFLLNNSSTETNWLIPSTNNGVTFSNTSYDWQTYSWVFSSWNSIQLNSTTELNFTNPFEVSAQIKPEYGGYFWTILCNRYSPWANMYGWEVLIRNNWTITFLVSDSVTLSYAISTTNLKDWNWHNVVCRYDWTNITIRVDWILEATASSITPWYSWIQSSYIGKNLYWDNFIWNIQKVKMWLI